MSLSKQLKEIKDFFESKSKEELDKIFEECGAKKQKESDKHIDKNNRG